MTVTYFDDQLLWDANILDLDLWKFGDSEQGTGSQGGVAVSSVAHPVLSGSNPLTQGGRVVATSHSYSTAREENPQANGASAAADVVARDVLAEVSSTEESGYGIGTEGWTKEELLIHYHLFSQWVPGNKSRIQILFLNLLEGSFSFLPKELQNKTPEQIKSVHYLINYTFRQVEEGKGSSLGSGERALHSLLTRKSSLWKTILKRAEEDLRKLPDYLKLPDYSEAEKERDNNLALIRGLIAEQAGLGSDSVESQAIVPRRARRSRYLARPQEVVEAKEENHDKLMSSKRSSTAETEEESESSVPSSPESIPESMEEGSEGSKLLGKYGPGTEGWSDRELLTWIHLFDSFLEGKKRSQNKRERPTLTPRVIEDLSKRGLLTALLPQKTAEQIRATHKQMLQAFIRGKKGSDFTKFRQFYLLLTEESELSTKIDRRVRRLIRHSSRGMEKPKKTERHIGASSVLSNGSLVVSDGGMAQEINQGAGNSPEQDSLPPFLLGETFDEWVARIGKD